MRGVRYLPHYTVEEYKGWQGDWELIDGIPVALASPKFTHQRVLTNLITQLNQSLEECPDCVVVAELDYIVSYDTVLRPDLSVICEEVEDYILRAPILVAEVVSEGTAERDEGVKKEIYEREGVKYYMLLYPEKKLSKLYKNTDTGYMKLKDIKEEEVEIELKENCKVKLRFSKVWH